MPYDKLYGLLPNFRYIIDAYDGRCRAFQKSNCGDPCTVVPRQILTEIHSYAKTEIIEFLAPVLNSDVEVDARCAQLSARRDKLCQTLCELFPEFGSRELYNRRRPHTYASDIFHIGITIRNSNIDKNMEAVH